MRIYLNQIKVYINTVMNYGQKYRNMHTHKITTERTTEKITMRYVFVDI